MKKLLVLFYLIAATCAAQPRFGAATKDRWGVIKLQPTWSYDSQGRLVIPGIGSGGSGGTAGVTSINGESGDVTGYAKSANVVSKTDYTNNRTTDQNATTNAQNTANTALAGATSATQTAANALNNSNQAITLANSATATAKSANDLANTKQDKLSVGANAQYRKGDNSLGTFALDVRALFSAGPNVTYDPNTGQISSTGGGGGGSSASLPFSVLSDLTSSGLQLAINNTPNGGWLIIPGRVVMTATVQINKPIHILGYNGWLDGGNGLSDLILINSTENVEIGWMKFSSLRNAGDGYGLVFVNDQGSVRNFSFHNNELTCPNGVYNAFSSAAWSEVANAGCFHTQWSLVDNWIHDCGRMGFELINHAWNGTYRYTDIDISRNRIYNTGINANEGMAISFSGQNKRLKASDNLIDQFRQFGIELIGSYDFSCTDNIITTDKTFAGSNGSSGYNLTDGGETESKGSPGKGAQHGSITGGYVRVTGRPITTFYAYDIEITGGKWYCGDYLRLQHCKRFDITGMNLESLFQSCIIFDDSQDCHVSGGRFSTANAVGGKYEQFGFYNNSTGNTLSGCRLVGSSDNGLNVKDAVGGNTNHWRVWFNGAELVN